MLGDGTQCYPGGRRWRPGYHDMLRWGHKREPSDGI